MSQLTSRVLKVDLFTSDNFTKDDNMADNNTEEREEKKPNPEHVNLKVRLLSVSETDDRSWQQYGDSQ